MWLNRFELKPGKWAYEPTEKTRATGLEIIAQIKKKWKLPTYYCHLQSGGHVQALNLHLHNKYFACLDIHDFFNSISRTRVTRTLKEYFNYNLARNIAKISTVKHQSEFKHSHCLPYGFPQSPILASICLYKSTLGIKLQKYHLNEYITVSVYMDDIIISSNNENFLTSCFNDLKTSATRSNFRLNSTKEFPPSKSVIVFNVELSHQHLLITESRLELFLVDYQSTSNNHKQEGILSYVNSINPIQTLSFN